MSLSVVIPNYNHQQYLPECIEGILQQTQRADEIIIIDDCSTDQSRKIIREYQKKEPKLRLIENISNQGPSYCVNMGAKEAKGEYLAICAADDFYFPQFFEKMIFLAKKYPTAALLCSGYFDFMDGQKPYGFRDQTFVIQEQELFFHPEDFVKFLWKTSFIIPSMTTIYKREVFLKYGFDEDMKSLCDFYLNYQIALRNPIAFLKEPLGAYRIRKNSYGDKMRWAIIQRSKLYSRWLLRITRSEDVIFQKRFSESGLISYGGKFLLFYLFFRPKFWYLYFHLLKKSYVKNICTRKIGKQASIKNN